MIRFMVRGAPGNPDFAPLGFIDAAKIAGVAPDHARRYLDRADVRALLLRERRMFRNEICAGNEGALLAIRDGAKNAMARIGAVKLLEEIRADDKGFSDTQSKVSPILTINLYNELPPRGQPVTIDGSTSRPPLPAPRPLRPEPEPEPERDEMPTFRWPE